MDIKIKNKYFFKNKKQMILYTVFFIILIIAFIYLGTRNYQEIIPDNELFASEFKDVSKDNIYKYYNAKEINNFLTDNATGIILFGSSQNKWTSSIANILNERAKEYSISEIMYYDFFEDRSINNGNYESIITKLSQYLYTNDLGKTELHAPTILIIKEGEIIYTYDSTIYIRGTITPENYWNSFNVMQLESSINSILDIYVGEYNE